MNRPSRNFSAIASHSLMSLKANLEMLVIIIIAKLDLPILNSKPTRYRLDDAEADE